MCCRLGLESRLDSHINALLIVLNRRVLPQQIRMTTGRLVALAWAVLLFGVLAVLTIIDRVGELIGG